MSESTIGTPVSATPDDFRTLMSGFPTGVAVVTATDTDGAQRGMTCSSLCGVSLEPPVLLVCLRGGSPTLDAVLCSGAFAVNLLHADARPTAELFASGDPHRFGKVPWEAGPQAAGPHLVRDAHTVADCGVLSAQPVGDHVTVYGEIRRVTRRGDRIPLLYGLRQFRPWPEH
ncbi:flavin reductase family protein [Streptomyces sp. DSM 40750]|uniref:flavin reductase family protein n=1 Tax=Streptomyces sp. DSM 40750 TaxID=2801030 RepID=UPI00214C8C25|nr:flavin reductase family protein [Streptomyces sp. DSM 40750]UUU22860.1 flavin reductase family protein [Streptomyces sp. DSM 40750]